ncbi:hypothetical protein A4X09_0g6815 [Tilletia walkeri]|uniref:Uncharacterized protein n=1 Tax=Tilletia walkeri TaxID=117179 RepID=A0A8X7N4E6_9BASI|nr:hypothetical protein A4X09_0g6815 [Tilletia walkeri]
MATTSEAIAWTLPPSRGMPDDVAACEDTVHGAYLNSGRMSESLAQLHSTSFLFKQVATRHDHVASCCAETVARVLMATQEDVKLHLTSVQNTFQDEVDDFKARLGNEIAMAHAAMKSRMEKELEFANAAIVRRMESMVSAVGETLREVRTGTHDGLVEAIDVLNACGSHLQRDINSTEHNYMRTLAHVVVGDTWSAA